MIIRETYLDLGDYIDQDDEERLEDIVASLKPGEKLILTMNRADAHEADDLIRYLEEQGFEIQPKGGGEDEYYLHCWRKDE